MLSRRFEGFPGTAEMLAPHSRVEEDQAEAVLARGFVVQEACSGRRLHRRALAAPYAYAHASVRLAPCIYVYAHTHAFFRAHIHEYTRTYFEDTKIVRYMPPYLKEEKGEEWEEEGPRWTKPPPGDVLCNVFSCPVGSG